LSPHSNEPFFCVKISFVDVAEVIEFWFVGIGLS
jgi:hypothetical protein